MTPKPESEREHGKGGESGQTQQEANLSGRIKQTQGEEPQFVYGRYGLEGPNCVSARLLWFGDWRSRLHLITEGNHSSPESSP